MLEDRVILARESLLTCAIIVSQTQKSDYFLFLPERHFMLVVEFSHLRRSQENITCQHYIFHILDTLLSVMRRLSVSM